MTAEGYSLGVLAAIVAGAAINMGMVIQKVAVRRLPGQPGLMRQLFRSRLWLLGFAFQFFIAVPLNMLAQAKIGPAIIPGLNSTGLVVLAIGAVVLARESLGRAEVTGILLVLGAITLFGLSRLAVDVRAVDVYDAGFLVRLVAFTAVVGALSLACWTLQSRTARWRGILRTLDAGLWFSQSNLWAGVVMGFVARWGGGQFSSWDLLAAGVGSAITFAGSMLGIAETQRAFQVGDAAKLVPIQAVPQQALPLASFFVVFALTPASPAALPLAGAAAVLILAGSGLLARRQAL